MGLHEELLATLKARMDKSGTTQEQLAERAGVSQAHVSRYLAGTRGKRSLATWDRLLDACDSARIEREQAEQERIEAEDAAYHARMRRAEAGAAAVPGW